MKEIVRKVLECVLALLPFLRKKNAKEVKDFSDLIAGQYEFLMVQLEKVLKDYFELSARVKEMHAEIFSLKDELAQALLERCFVRECEQRKLS